MIQKKKRFTLHYVIILYQDNNLVWLSRFSVVQYMVVKLLIQLDRIILFQL